MSDYPKLLFNQSMSCNGNICSASFYIRNVLSSNSFRTAYYDIFFDNNKLKIIKDDIKATQLAGYNYHKNAEIRTAVFSGEVNTTQQKFLDSITHKSDTWAKLLLNLNNVSDSKKTIHDFVENTLMC
jgi:hypothetical protein